MIKNIFDFIRSINLDILISICTLFTSIYIIWKQKVHIKIENVYGKYFIDYAQGCSEDGKEYIELIPTIRIINKSQMPISIYSIDIELKNKGQLYTSSRSKEKAKEVQFFNQNGEGIAFKPLLYFIKPIDLNAYQVIDGNLDFWVNGNVLDLENAKISIKTSRGVFKRKIKFNEIDSDMNRVEI